MKLLQLQYFCAIAEYENMSRAASLMNVAQSALSKSLSMLEEELGVRLFDRVGKSLVLNENGRILYEQAAYALSLLDNAAKRLKNPSERLGGEVVLCIDSLIPYLPDLIRAFHAKYPNIKLKTASSEDCKQLRATGDYDVVITSCPVERKEVQESVLVRDEFVLLVPEDHPLAFEKDTDLAQVHSEPFVYCCRMGDMLSKCYNALCTMANFTPHIILEGADLGMATTLVRAHQGVSILPASAIAALSPQMKAGNALVRIRSPYFTQSIYSAAPLGKVKTTSAQAFLDFVSEYFSKFYPDGICGLNHRIDRPSF